MAKMDLSQKTRSVFMEFIDSIPTSKTAAILFVDKTTISLVSMALSHSEAISKRILLFKTLEEDFDPLLPSMSSLSVLFFVSPSANTLGKTIPILSSPKLLDAHFVFSTAPSTRIILRLAELDANEAISSVKWLPLAFFPAGEHLFTLSVPPRNAFDSLSTTTLPNNYLFKEDIDAIASVLEVTKKSPVIRYSACSSSTLSFAKELNEHYRNNPSEEKSETIVLILDRRTDPISPLLFQWTYQAMIHEVFSIERGIVDFSNDFGQSRKKIKIALNDKSDSFFNKNKNLNFSQIGIVAQETAQSFSESADKARNFGSLDEMQKFVEDCPEIVGKSDLLKKHISLLSSLSSAVKQRKLMDLSAIEQEIACGVNIKPSAIFQQIKELFASKKYGQSDLLRICLIFVLRFPRSGEVGRLKLLLRRLKINKRHVIDKILNFFGGIQRQSHAELFSEGIINKSMKTIQHAIKGVENIYTRHEPLISLTLQQILGNKLSERDYPFVSKKAQSPACKSVLVYILGGCTYEESICVDRFNSKEGVEVLLGSQLMLNSKTFVKELIEF